jgi:hypothetical protein
MYEAVKELMTIAEDCEALNALPLKRNLEALAPNGTTPDPQRTLDDPTGGPL